MINKAMFYDKNKLNEFTTEVKRQCLKNGKCLVKLRNKTFKEIYFHLADETDEEDRFIGEDWSGVWDFDGSSVTSSDYDMVELHDDSV